MNLRIKALTPKLSDDCEAFPVIRSKRYERDCAGPYRLHEKAGFAKVSENDGVSIVRCELEWASL
ncbi:MAG: hypothetical protein RR177_01065 [Oscillospiraceae bacterium]